METYSNRKRLDRAEFGGPLGGDDAGDNGDEQGPADDPGHGGRFHAGRDLAKVVDRVVEDLAGR